MSKKRLLLSAFVMNTGSHIRGGQWRHPNAQQHRFNELSLWVDLAQQLEAAHFDALFFADVVGLYGDHEGSYDSLAHKGLQIPSNDPLILLSALSAVTENIGLAVTSSVIQAHPFQFARQLSTLDHLSNGRAAWNIVTSGLENAHRNFGSNTIVEHDARYDWADEYLEVVYKLWEGSWKDDALQLDKEASVFADGSKIHKINHAGSRYSVEGPHLSSPSAQRTPVLFQAGTSERGTSFAAQHAEATFVFSPSPEHAHKVSQKIRAKAVAAGRHPEAVKLFAGLSFTVGSTEEEASQKKEEELAYLDPEAILAHIGGGLGIDLGGLDLDTPLGDVQTQGSRGVLEAIKASTPGKNPTLADLVHYRTEAQHITGTPEHIVDVLEQWQAAGVDGINIINSLLPGSYTDFIEYVLPELQKRGLAQTSYAPGTLREKLFGKGSKLPDEHPGAAYRTLF